MSTFVNELPVMRSTIQDIGPEFGRKTDHVVNQVLESSKMHRDDIMRSQDSMAADIASILKIMQRQATSHTSLSTQERYEASLPS